MVKEELYNIRGILLLRAVAKMKIIHPLDSLRG